MLYLKVHDSGNREIIALCDEELIGKTFRDNGIKLEVNERFYKGELKDLEEVKDRLNAGENFNIVGEKAIKLCVELELIDETSVLNVEGIPYAMVLRL